MTGNNVENTYSFLTSIMLLSSLFVFLFCLFVVFVFFFVFCFCFFVCLLRPGLLVFTAFSSKCSDIVLVALLCPNSTFQIPKCSVVIVCTPLISVSKLKVQ